jgi:hypothetical protein
MAATVTKIRSWEEGDRFGKFIAWVVDCSVALSTQGAEAADMPASSFGMSKIYSAFCYRATDGSAVERAEVVFTDGNSVYVGDLVQSSDASRGAATDVTETVYLIVKGKP